MAEQQLTRSIVKALNALPGVWARRMNAGSTSYLFRGNEPGTPDVMAMIDGGRVIWLEVKTEKSGTKAGELSKSQRDWHARAAELEHTVTVVRTVQEALDVVRSRMQRERAA